MDHSEMPKGWSSMAGFVPALRQRLRPWGEVRLRCPSKARGVCSGQQGLGRGRSGAIQFCPAYPVGSVWRRRGVAGSIASGPKERPKMPKGRSSMVGGEPAVRKCCCPWGEVRFGATESDGRLSGVRFFRSVAFADAKGSGVGLGWVTRMAEIHIALRGQYPRTLVG